MSIGGKLQFSFFMLTMATIVGVRWETYRALVRLIERVCGGIASTVDSKQQISGSSGMKLRLHQALDANHPSDLKIVTPCDDLTRYQSQWPVTPKAKVAWQRQEGGRLYCGIKFVELNADSERQSKVCFEYFHKEPRFSEAA